MEFSRSTLIAAYPVASCAWRVIRRLMDTDYAEDQVGLATRNLEATCRQGRFKGALWAPRAVMATGLFEGVLTSTGTDRAGARLYTTLIGLGMTKEEGHYLLEKFQQGRTIIAVRHPAVSEQARALLGSEASDFLWSRELGARSERAVHVA